MTDTQKTAVPLGDCLKTLITEEQIRKRIREMGATISRDYAGTALHLVCILKGASMFLADLLRSLELDVSIDFIAVSSYKRGTTTTGEVQLTKDLDFPLEARDVLIVEDIVDTGVTLNYLYHLLQSRAPRSLKIASLLDKPSRRLQPIDVHYIGFEIPDAFVVGYGLDYGERYRQLPDVCVLETPNGVLK
jgi:hypoxanthine phosphoribosyltransferase